MLIPWFGAVMKRPGFTLIETLMASALAFMLMIAIAELWTGALRAQHKADTVSAMMTALAVRIESLKAMEFTAAELDPGKHSETVTALDGRTTLALEYTVEKISSGLKLIDIAAIPAGHPEAATAASIYISAELEGRR